MHPQRLLISEMPEAVLLPKIRDVLQDPLVGPDNIRKILGIDRMKQLYSSAVQPQQQSVLLRCVWRLVVCWAGRESSFFLRLSPCNGHDFPSLVPETPFSDARYASNPDLAMTQQQDRHVRHDTADVSAETNGRLCCARRQGIFR